MAGKYNEKTPLFDKKKTAEPLASNCGNCFVRTKRILSYVTVEPALVLYALGFGLESVFMTNLWVDKTCLIHYGFGEGVCAKLDSGMYTQQQDTVQRLVNQYNVYRHIVEYLPALVVVLLLGAWSDRRGRRLPILVPALGQLLMGLGLVANSYWWSLPPSFILLAYFPVGLTGGAMGLFMGIYAYVSATSTREARTTRMSVVGVILFLVSPAGKYLGTVIYGCGGYVAVFGAMAMLDFLSVLYVLVRLKEHPEGARAETSSKAGVCEALSPAHLKVAFLAVWRPREGRARTHILVHIFIVCVQVFNFGLINYDFLYTRKRFSWDYNDFTLWSIVSMPLSSAGTIVVIPLLSYYFRVEDSMLGFAGGVSALFTYVLRATAPAPWVFYLSTVVSLLSSTVLVASRAAVSKLVEKTELGAVFAVLAAAETVTPVLSSFVYTYIYNATLDTFPGTIYVAAAVGSVIICCSYVWLLTHGVYKYAYKQVPHP
ncbi:solute carrier family 46 member 3-like [Penaeus monodon]|uniref:solute carrier family 46 member 3-like n=1 Tax=Penaeus monodon TaxID=6687 RepID=UPI0018A7A3C4|nr:solute carrier family 46 member 3-like [Penaeus monodon]